MQLNQPAAQSAITGGAPAIVRNNLQALASFKVKVVSTAQGAETNLLIFPGPTPAWLIAKFTCVAPDQTDTTLSSTVSAGNATGYGEFKAYLANVGMYITSIRITTTDTTVFTSGSLFLGEMPPNGIAAPQEIILAQYTTGLGGGVDTSLVISDVQFVTSGNFFLYLSTLPASCTLNFEFVVGGIADSSTVNAM